MKRTLFPVIFLLGLHASAQINYVRTYPLPPNTEIHGSDVTPDGGMVLCGVSGPSKGFLMRLDVAGNVLWTRAYSSIGADDIGHFGAPFTNTLFYDVAVLSDSAFLVCGAGSAISDYDNLLARFDGNGGLVWANTYGNTWYQAFRAIEPLDANTAIATGYTGGLMVPRHVVARIDVNDGYYLGGADLAIDPVYGTGRHSVCTDGGFVVSAEANFGRFIAKLDTDFVIQWEQEWMNFHVDASACLTDSSVIAVGDSNVVRLLADGTVDWSQQLLLGGGAITDAVARPDGKVLLCGWAGTDAHAWSAVMDTSGAVLLATRYGDPGEDFRAVRIDLVATGDARVVGTSAGGTGVFVAAADPDGQLPGCGYAPFSIPAVPLTLVTATDTIAQMIFTSFFGDLLVPAGSAMYVWPGTTCADGGTFSASGMVFNDADQSGAFGTGEPGFPYGALSVQPGTGFTFTNGQGAFDFRPPTTGTHQISFTPNSPWWALTSDSASYTVAFTATDTVFTDLDFGFTPVLDTTVLIGSLVNTSWWCSGSAQQHISLLNAGTTTPQGVVGLTLDSLFTFIGSSPLPDSIVGNTLFWSFDSLGWYQFWQQELSVQMPDASHIGDTTLNTVMVWADDGLGGLALVETVELTGVVSCAFDPNDKQVTPQGDGAYGAIPFDTEWLQYTVRFQNTGTDTAYTVVVEDLLSPHLDHGSLQVLGMSHPLSALDMSNGGLARFSFENILLPDSNVNEPASHGFITFRVRTLSGLQHLTTIQNNAGIYFDLNAPVITNVVLNTIIDCAQAQWSVTLYDNGGGWLTPYTFFMDTMLYSYQWLLNGTAIPGATTLDWTALVSGDYSVALTDVYGCTVVSDVVNVIVSGAADLPDLSIAVMPNPFNSGARLSFNRPIGAADAVEVIDVNGRILRTLAGTGSHELRIDRSDLPQGLYVVRVKMESGVGAVCRVVVE